MLVLIIHKFELPDARSSSKRFIIDINSKHAAEALLESMKFVNELTLGVVMI